MFISENECFELGINYPGNDLNSCGVKTDTAEQCQQLCAERDGCVQFTWISSSFGDVNRRRKCCLKKAHNNNPTSKTGLVSGPKICGNMNNVIVNNSLYYYQIS